MRISKNILFFVVFSIPVLYHATAENDDSFSIIKFIDPITFISSSQTVYQLEGIAPLSKNSSTDFDECLSFVKSMVSRANGFRVEYDERQESRSKHALIYLFLIVPELTENLSRDTDVIRQVGANQYEIFLNAYLVKHGYAKTAIVAPNTKYMDFFLSLEEEARLKEKGLFRKDLYR